MKDFCEKDFVIKPRSKYFGDPKAHAVREAMRTYASLIESVDLSESNRVYEWVDKEDDINTTLQTIGEKMEEQSLNLDKYEDVPCECGSDLYVVKWRLKKIPAQSGKDEIASLPFFICDKCGRNSCILQGQLK